MARALLIIATIIMLLISIHPSALRKIFLLAIALLSLSSAICFADPVFMTKQYAPSDANVRLAPTQPMLHKNRSELNSNRTSNDRSVHPFEDNFAAVSLGLLGRRDVESPIAAGRATSSFSTLRACWLCPVALLEIDDPAMARASGF